MTERKRYTKQTYGTPYNHIKPRQCKYDRVRTLTVHYTNKRRTRQCKYDRVRTQRYTIQTTQHIMIVENINGYHVITLKPYQCEYDRVRTLTVHHTNKRRTRQCKYDRVRTQRYTIQTRRHRMSVENRNGTHRNPAKALSM